MYLKGANARRQRTEPAIALASWALWASGFRGATPAHSTA